jgi:hypothetical protein
VQLGTRVAGLFAEFAARALGTRLVIFASATGEDPVGGRGETGFVVAELEEGGTVGAQQDDTGCSGEGVG